MCQNLILGFWFVDIGIVDQWFPCKRGFFVVARSEEWSELCTSHSSEFLGPVVSFQAWRLCLLSARNGIVDYQEVVNLGVPLAFDPLSDRQVASSGIALCFVYFIYVVY